MFVRDDATGMFRQARRQDEAGAVPVEAAARFGTQIPLEYAYAAWAIPAPEAGSHAQRAQLRGFQGVTVEDIRQLAAQRCRALHYLEQRFTHKNRGIDKAPFDLTRLGRCFKPVDLLPSRSQSELSTRGRDAMIIQVLHCPYCQGIDIVKHGLSSEGKQRYRCRACLEGRGRTFLLEYSYAGQSPAVKQQIVDMAMNASGIRDTARVLHVSPTTVINELKKRPPTCKP